MVVHAEKTPLSQQRVLSKLSSIAFAGARDLTAHLEEIYETEKFAVIGSVLVAIP